MTATILQADGNRTDPARFGLDLEGKYFAQGTELMADFSLFDSNQLLQQRFSVVATTPINFPAWDWLELLYFETDRRYQNWELGKVEQNPLDIRVDIYPRVDSEFSRLNSVSLTAEYVSVDEVDFDECLVLIEKAAMQPRWVFEPTENVTSFRITTSEDFRVTTESDQRVARVNEVDPMVASL